MAYLLVKGQDVGLVAEQVLNGLYNSYVLLAVPLFIFAANIMNSGTISERLFAFAHALVGPGARRPGARGHHRQRDLLGHERQRHRRRCTAPAS